VYEYSTPEQTARSRVLGLSRRSIPTLQGVYVYGDYCVSKIELFRWRRWRRKRDTGLAVDGGSLASLRRSDGELYALSLAAAYFTSRPRELGRRGPRDRPRGSCSRRSLGLHKRDTTMAAARHGRQHGHYPHSPSTTAPDTVAAPNWSRAPSPRRMARN